MPLPLLALAVASFGIGTTEFVIMGLLPEVAADLGVSIPGAGMLVSGYALGVVVGATLVGPDVSEMLHAATIAVVAEVPIDRLWHAVQPAARCAARQFGIAGVGFGQHLARLGVEAGAQGPLDVLVGRRLGDPRGAVAGRRERRGRRVLVALALAFPYVAPLLIGVLGGNKEFRRNAWAVGF